MRPPSDVEAEAWVLTTESGLALLAEVGGVHRPGPGDLALAKRSDGRAGRGGLRLAWSRAGNGQVRQGRTDVAG